MTNAKVNFQVKTVVSNNQKFLALTQVYAKSYILMLLILHKHDYNILTIMAIG